MKRSHRRFGFTIIELLVAIAVIGILASIVTLTYSNVQAESRDRQRLADMEMIVSALEKYKAEFGEYPEEQAMPSHMHAAGWELSNHPNGFLAELKTSGTVKEVPTDPKSQNIGGNPNRNSDNFVYFYHLYNPGGPSGACDPSRGKIYIFGMTRMEAVAKGQPSPDSPNFRCPGGPGFAGRHWASNGAWVTGGFTN